MRQMSMSLMSDSTYVRDFMSFSLLYTIDYPYVPLFDYLYVYVCLYIYKRRLNTHNLKNFSD